MNELINLGNGQYVKVCMLKGQQGDNIQTIAKTSTNVLVDTYTITLTDGSTQTFTVTNGKGIASIEKTGTSGLVDTYTITFNDNTTQTFTVTNGNGIVSIEKTATAGLVDTYTITLNSGSPVTFTVTNGKGISSIAKTSTSGLVDTYTITYNDNTTSTFDVTNGANGQDVSQSNLAPVETGNTASQSYAVGEHLVWNGVYYVVTQAIAVQDSFIINGNISQKNISDEIGQTNKASGISGDDIYSKLGTLQSKLTKYSTSGSSSASMTWSSFLDSICPSFENTPMVNKLLIRLSRVTSDLSTNLTKGFFANLVGYYIDWNYTPNSYYLFEAVLSLSSGNVERHVFKLMKTGSTYHVYTFNGSSFTRTDKSSTNITADGWQSHATFWFSFVGL